MKIIMLYRHFSTIHKKNPLTNVHKSLLIVIRNFSWNELTRNEGHLKGFQLFNEIIISTSLCFSGLIKDSSKASPQNLAYTGNYSKGKIPSCFCLHFQNKNGLD